MSAETITTTAVQPKYTKLEKVHQIVKDGGTHGVSFLDVMKFLPDAWLYESVLLLEELRTKNVIYSDNINDYNSIFYVT